MKREKALLKIYKNAYLNNRKNTQDLAYYRTHSSFLEKYMVNLIPGILKYTCNTHVEMNFNFLPNPVFGIFSNLWIQAY